MIGLVEKVVGFSGGSGNDGLEDARESGAAAEIAGKAFSDLRHGRVRIDGEQLSSRHQHAGRTDAALSAAALEERLLQRVQFSIDGETFNGLDARAFGLQHGHKTAIYEFAIHAHGAGATLAFAASLLGASEVQIFAQHVEETLHRQGSDGNTLAVHRESNGGTVGTHTGAVSTCGSLTANSRKISSGSREWY